MQVVDLAGFDGDQRVVAQRLRHVTREGVTVDGEGAARGQAVTVGHRHDQPVSGAHFPMQKADGVLFVVIRAQRVGADHLGQVAGAMGEGAGLGAHFMDHHGHAHIGGLPCSLGPGHAATDDMKCRIHAPRCRRLRGLWKGRGKWGGNGAGVETDCRADGNSRRNVKITLQDFDVRRNRGVDASRNALLIKTRIRTNRMILAPTPHQKWQNCAGRKNQCSGNGLFPFGQRKR